MSRPAPRVSRCRSPLGIGQVGLAHLDVVQAHDRIDLDGVGVGLLADDLAVHLALGRHVDDEVAEDARVAAEPAAGRKARRARRSALSARVNGDEVVARAT